MGAKRVIGVDLGGTKLLAGVVREDGVVVGRTLRPTPVRDQKQLLETLAEAVAELLDAGVAALGLGIPSSIDQRRGRAVSSVHVPLADVDIRAVMAERFGLPVGVDNDANAAALAEHRFGAGRGTSEMVMLTIGTGIGGGLILGGQIYRGAVGAAAELGHMTIELDGPPCPGNCPGRGHLEALASGSAADAMARRLAAERPGGDLGRTAAHGREVDARLAVELAELGPGDAREVVSAIGYRLGVGVASLVNMLNPELVVIGGGFARAGELLLDPIRRVVREQALPPARDIVRIVCAELGAEAGLVGAGLVALEALEHALAGSNRG